MDEVAVLKEEAQEGHRMIDAAMSDLTVEVAHWHPGGTANSIAAILAHTVIVEDDVVNKVFKSGQLLFETSGWSAKTGIPNEHDDIWKSGWSLDIEGFNAYRAEVAAAVERFLDEISAEEMEGEIEAWGRTLRKGWLLRIESSSHVFSHLGEVSVLRGIKGLEGLPI